jgi:mannose-6-phosphate isomerase-like protein (cupin superfamily)
VNLELFEESDAEKIAEMVVEDEKIIPEVIGGLSSEDPKVKYRCGKALMILSEKNPRLIYSFWDDFLKLLNIKNTFLKSNGIIILANLAKIDSEQKFEKIFNKFYELLNDKSMITAANVISYSVRIAKAKPNLQAKISNKLLSVDMTHHSEECKNILKGKAIVVLEEYIGEIKDNENIIHFVRNELKNSRPATRKKAEKFVEHWNKVSI